MLAPISAGRRDNLSSFHKLQTYLISERDPETGEVLLRGEVILSPNILSLQTAASEMAGVAALNTRSEEPVFHYQLAWTPGEKPTREQWEQAALNTYKNWVLPTGVPGSRTTQKANWSIRGNLP